MYWLEFGTARKLRVACRVRLAEMTAPFSEAILRAEEQPHALEEPTRTLEVQQGEADSCQCCG
jgi:hypothetical protein